MTVNELEKELCAGEDCVVCVPMRDVIADWRLMRDALHEEWANGGIVDHADITALLAKLRCKP